MSSTPNTPNATPVYVPGGKVIHAGRRIGQYPSGEVKWSKLCATDGAARYRPSAVDPATPITCKRCLSKLAQLADRAAARAELNTPEARQLIADGLAEPDSAPAGTPVNDHATLTHEMVLDAIRTDRTGELLAQYAEMASECGARGMARELREMAEFRAEDHAERTGEQSAPEPAAPAAPAGLAELRAWAYDTLGALAESIDTRKVHGPAEPTARELRAYFDTLRAPAAPEPAPAAAWTPEQRARADRFGAALAAELGVSPELAPAAPNAMRPEVRAEQLAELLTACAQLAAPAAPRTAPRAAQLAAESAADDYAAARMTGAQYAELVGMACRAELARARSAGAGLRLTREQYAELLADLTGSVGLAGLERAHAIDTAAGYTDRPRDGYAPRWVGIYAEQHAEQTSGAEWSTLYGAGRAQLARNRWVHWLRLTARHELAQLAERARAESGSADGAELAESLPAARLAHAEQLADTLAEQLAEHGRPMGALERAAVSAVVSGLTHRERAELTGSTPEACKTYAAKGRAALRKRWITTAGARAELRAAARAADAADLLAAAELRGISPAVLRRAELRQRRADLLAAARKNAERCASGHAGGVIREMVTSATPEDGSGQLSRVEMAGRGAVSHAVHRGHAPAYRRAELLMGSLAHRARMDRAARIARRAELARRAAAGARRAAWLAEQRA